MVLFAGYLAFGSTLLTQYVKGRRKHKPKAHIIKTGRLMWSVRYTTRDSKGRFTGNKKSFWDILEV
ncbi:hypothetical protein LILPAPAWES_7 [Morganella phage vB_MmoP_Lilpapawes]|uniref:Uncharacterized protein n=1 Tax=Morganella phage vB_MmoP_Lilpapawes TaxID=2894803 RepID=A0AAE9CAW5_9CAUD|nr:hypothetical protein LILPAPAWES_7 [Morganella phage vB_MmoP_Lilpapawes]